MTRPAPKRDLVFALLIAVWAHVGLFFIFVLLLFFDLLAAKIIKEESKPEVKKEPIKMRMVYEEAIPLPLGSLVPPTANTPEEVAMPPEPESQPEPEPEKNPESGFVQTSEEQESDNAPDGPSFIGERNTSATSDKGAVAGDEKMSALAGDEEVKQDVKTFDSNFSAGENSGAQDGINRTIDPGAGKDQMNEEAVAEVDPDPLEEPLPEMEEDIPESKEDLVSIDRALAALEEAIGDDNKQAKPKPKDKVEETMPEKPATKAREASNQDGGFAPKANKTKVAGILSADGAGSVNVTDSPAGRYQAGILKKLETAWQMENIRNRSLLAPGNITLYFTVSKTGKISGQKRVSMIGASGTQWGMIIRALNGIEAPKMSQAVIKDLGGKSLEFIVTFNY